MIWLLAQGNDWLLAGSGLHGFGSPGRLVSHRRPRPLRRGWLLLGERYVKHRCYLGAGAGGCWGVVEFC